MDDPVPDCFHDRRVLDEEGILEGRTLTATRRPTPVRGPVKSSRRDSPARESGRMSEPRDLASDGVRDAMSLLTNRKHIMTLFSGSRDPWSHRARIVLKEKEIECDVVEVDVSRKPRELADLNPYNQVPTLVDRDLADRVPATQILTDRSLKMKKQPHAK
jgi:glutaredoxin